MTGGQRVETTKSKGVRISLASLLMIQLSISPVLLSPFYGTFGPDRWETLNPVVALVSMVLAPACYAAVFVAWSEFRRRNASRRSLLRLIGHGCLYGSLFCVLSLGPLAIPVVIDLVRGSDVVHPVGFVTLVVVALAYYVMIGAAMGGIVGIVRDLFNSRPQLVKQ